MGRWSEHVEKARKAYVDKDMKQVLEEIGLAEKAASGESDTGKKEAQKVISAFKNFLGPIHEAAAQGQLNAEQATVDPHAEQKIWYDNFMTAVNAGDERQRVFWGAKLLEVLNPNDYGYDTFYDHILSSVATANMGLGWWYAAIRPMTMLVRRMVDADEDYGEQLNTRILLANCLGNCGYFYLAVSLVREVEQYANNNKCDRNSIVLLDKLQAEQMPHFTKGIQGAKIAATQIIAHGNSCAEAGNFIQAANNYEQAAAIYRKCFGRSSETTISAISMMAEALLKAGRSTDAKAYRELVIAEAARLLERAFYISDIEVYQLLNDTIKKGLTYAQANLEQQKKMEKLWDEFCIFPEKYPEAHKLCKSAERISREAISKLEKSGFPVRDLLSQGYLCLGKSLSTMGQSDDAVKCFEQSEQYKNLDYGFLLDDIEIEHLPFDGSNQTVISVPV